MFHQLLHEQLKDHLSETHLLDPSIQRFMQTINESYTNYEKLQVLHNDLLEGYTAAHLKFLTRLKASPGLNTKTITRLTAAIKEEKDRKKQASECFEYIADLFQNEAEQRNMAEQKLNGAKEIVEKAAHIQLQFLLMTGAQFGDPLNVILKFIEKISEEPLSENQQKQLGKIRYTSESLLFQIKDIVEYNDIKQGFIKLKQDPFDLAELIREVGKRYEEPCSAKHTTLDINIYPGLPAMVIGDRFKLGQVLHNLVSNAVNYTADGKIIIDVFPLLSAGGKVVLQFKITDTGTGIEPARQAHLFDELFIHKKSGKGLGLIITKTLLTLMGSDIHMKSIQGKGTVFQFDLQLPCIHSLHDNPDNANFRMNDLRVLLAEEDPMHLNFIVHFLEKWNIQYDVATNGSDAASLAGKNYYDAAFIDYRLTGIDGYTSAAIIKTILPSAFIVLLAGAESVDKGKLTAAGVNLCCEKPINSVKLFQLLYRIKKMKPLNNGGFPVVSNGA